MRLFRREQPSEPEGPVPDEWAVSEGNHNGKRLIARFRTGARPWVGSSKYPIQIGVAVPLVAPDGDGMPGGVEAEQLTAFEDALIGRAVDRAILVGVITTSGMREFVLYTGSGEWIALFHEDLIAALPTHTVQVMAKTDPKWSTYRQFVSS
jgi:hypothetical protein